MFAQRSSALLATVTLAAAVLVTVPASSASAAPVTATVAPQAEPTDYRSVVRTLRTEIPELMAASGVVGLGISLVDGDRIVWTEGFGSADRRTRRAVTPDTAFHIGSVSKTFAAVAVMQLVERGLVDLDEPLATYVPGFRLLPKYRHNVITVRSVLDHHSGIPGDVFNGLITSGTPDPQFRAWLLQALRQMAPERRVNTLTAYNNSGFVLLENLIENVSGMTLDEYAARYLFAPMGMPTSSFNDRLVSDRVLTRNYQAEYDSRGRPTGVVLKPREYVNGPTAGSITSTPREMANYLRTLLSDGRGPDGRVLRAATLRQMFTPQIRTPLDAGPTTFGLGFAVGAGSMDWAGTVVWHDGATVWNHSMLRLLPDSDLGVFVTINTTANGGVNYAVADRALSLAYTAKTGNVRPDPIAPPESPEVTPTPAQLRQHAGMYAASDGLWRVEARGNRLVLTQGAGTRDAVRTNLRAHADGWFRPANGTGPIIRFRTIEGKRLLQVWAAAVDRMVILNGAERIPDGTVTRAWERRFGQYRAIDAAPHVHWSLVAKSARITSRGGVLVLNLSSAQGLQSIVPGWRGNAFTFGQGFASGRGKGEIVVPLGPDRFRYLGVTYERVTR
jgi:CubicO group peptidase (beta-lactamase class C family)